MSRSFDNELAAYVFHKTGASLSPDEIHADINKACERAGVPREGMTIMHPVFQKMLADIRDYDVWTVNGVIVAI